MVKVLVADENTEEIRQCTMHLLNKVSKLETLSASTGIDTIDTYNKAKADILILNSHFSDIKSTKIVDTLSSTIQERKNSNIILTTNSENEQLAFVNTAKIYKFVQKPLNYDEIVDTVNEIKLQNSYDVLDENVLNKLLFSMRIVVGSFQTQILKEAINECYYYPYLLDNFDVLISILSQKHNSIPTESIRSSIRHSLYNLNKNKDKLQNHKIVKMFEQTKSISPKTFLEAVVSYLHSQKNQEIIF